MVWAFFDLNLARAYLRLLLFFLLQQRASQPLKAAQLFDVMNNHLFDLLRQHFENALELRRLFPDHLDGSFAHIAIS